MPDKLSPSKALTCYSLFTHDARRTTHDGRRMTHDDGQRPVTIDPPELKILKLPVNTGQVMFSGEIYYN